MKNCECNCRYKKSAKCDPKTKKGCLNPAIQEKPTQSSHAKIGYADSPDSDTFLFNVLERITSR